MTLSYVNGTYKTQLLSEVESAVQKGQSELASTLASQITSFKKRAVEKSRNAGFQSLQERQSDRWKLLSGPSRSAAFGPIRQGLGGRVVSHRYDRQGKWFPDQGQLKEYHLYISSAECSIVASR